MTTDQSQGYPNPTWQRILKPAQITETRLIEAILEGRFPINSHLPSERELAESLGVTRPTLREALQRLARDGWVEIRQGKPTRVRNFWKEGSLGVLNTLANHSEYLPDNFVSDLLTVRLAIAPTYAALALAKAPDQIYQSLEGRHALEDDPQAFTQFDWQVHHVLTLLSENPVFVLVLNGFENLYLQLAPAYFSISAARQHSMHFYQDLSQAAAKHDPEQARILTEQVMRESIDFWQQIKIA